MKVCGYCNNEYADNELKCPVCGSTLLKHTGGSSAAAAEYDRIKNEIANKRRRTSKILTACVIAVIAIIVGVVVALVAHFNSPEYKLDKENNNLLSQAKHDVNDGNYEDAYNTLKKIDPSWDDYEKVEDLRTLAVRKELEERISELREEKDYKAIIVLIKSKVEDVDADPDIKAIYDEAARDYTSEILPKAESYVASGDFDSARDTIRDAISVLGENATFSNILTEIETTNIRTNLDKYLAASDYAGVVSYLETVVDEYSQFGSDLDTYTQKYIELVLAQADEKLKAPDYSSALAVINEAIALVGDKTALVSKKTEIEDANINATIISKMTTGGSAEVVSYLQTIVKDYPRFESVLSQYTQKYIDETISKADTSLNQSDFSSAKDVLNRAINLIGNDASLTSKLAEVEMAEVNAMVEKCVKQNDYVGLVAFLKPLANKSNDYKAMFDQYSQTLKERTLAAAEALASERKFEDAIQTIKSVQNTFDCTEFKNAISGYEEYLPKQLGACHVIESHLTNASYTDLAATDCFGKKHEHCIVFDCNYYSENDYVVFSLGGKYVKLEGSICVDSHFDSDMSASLEIYADGVKIYETGALKRTTANKSLSIDVSGVSQLEIRYTGEKARFTYSGDDSDKSWAVFVEAIVR